MPLPRIMRACNFLIAFAVLLLDRCTKRLVAAHITLGDSITVIRRIFYITHVENSGAAFGIFNDSPSHWKIALLVTFSLAPLVIVSALLSRSTLPRNPQSEESAVSANADSSPLESVRNDMLDWGWLNAEC